MSVAWSRWEKRKNMLHETILWTSFELYKDVAFIFLLRELHSPPLTYQSILVSWKSRQKHLERKEVRQERSSTIYKSLRQRVTVFLGWQRIVARLFWSHFTIRRLRSSFIELARDHRHEGNMQICLKTQLEKIEEELAKAARLGRLQGEFS